MPILPYTVAVRLRHPINRLRRWLRGGLPTWHHPDYRLPIASLAHTTGLEPRRADLAIWDVEHPAELAYRIGFNPLHMRMIGGRA